MTISLLKSPLRSPTPANNFRFSAFLKYCREQRQYFLWQPPGLPGGGVYLSEGIADFVADVITAIVIFTSFPRIFKQREALVKRGEAI